MQLIGIDAATSPQKTGLARQEGWIWFVPPN